MLIVIFAYPSIALAKKCDLSVRGW